MADTSALKAADRNIVWVRLPPPAFNMIIITTHSFQHVYIGNIRLNIEDDYLLVDYDGAANKEFPWLFNVRGFDKFPIEQILSIQGLGHPFIPKSRWIKWKDIERQPYHSLSADGVRWLLADDERLFLIALDRYADYLQRKDGREGIFT